MVKHLPTIRETRVQSLRSREDLLEKEIATHSSILAWKIPWTEEPGGLQSMGVKESGRTEQLMLTYLHFFFKETVAGTPLHPSKPCHPQHPDGFQILGS